MAPGCVSRCLLTGLHMLAGLAAGGSLLSVVLQWAQDLSCLPPVSDVYGDFHTEKNALWEGCDVITYSCTVVCGLSLLMALTINCCWPTWGWAFIHQVLTLLMALLAAGGAAALTVDCLLWCDSLQHAMGIYTGCADAADYYDTKHHTTNMTAYFRKLEIQQACQWAVVPLTLIAVIIYTIAIRNMSLPHGHALQLAGRYYILHNDELSPLLPAENGERAERTVQVSTPVPRATETAFAPDQ